MDHGAILSHSIAYTKEFCLDFKRWFIVLLYFIVNVCTFGLIPLYSGYLIRVLSTKEGDAPTGKLGNLFVLGWKYLIASIVWFLPMVIFAVIAFAMFFTVAAVEVTTIGPGAISEPENIMSSFMASFIAMMGIGLIILIVTIVLSLFYCMGLVNMARKDSLRKAFSVTEILAIIRKIGWVDYIIGLLIPIIIIFGLFLLMELLTYVLMIPVLFSPILGLVLMIIWTIIMLVISIPLSIFFYYYLSQIYNEGLSENAE